MTRKYISLFHLFAFSLQEQNGTDIKQISETPNKMENIPVTKSNTTLSVY